MEISISPGPAPFKWRYHVMAPWMPSPVEGRANDPTAEQLRRRLLRMALGVNRRDSCYQIHIEERPQDGEDIACRRGA